MQHISWDDAKYVLALARKGTYRDAAKSLSVNHTTVSRRITELERRLSANLFQKTPSGFLVTPSGKILCETAERMEDLLLGSMKRIQGADEELAGDVHIHIPDIFSESVCKKMLPLIKQHPKLKIHLSSETNIVNLARREADIALRFTQDPPLEMVGKRVSQIPMAVYARSDYDINPSQPLSTYPWVRWSTAYSQSQVEKWTEVVCAGSPAVTRVNTYQALVLMIRNGVGIGCLSPWYADKDKSLKRISPLIEEASMDIWLLIHPDLRGVRRIKVVRDSIASIFEKN